VVRSRRKTEKKQKENTKCKYNLNELEKNMIEKPEVELKQ